MHNLGFILPSLLGLQYPGNLDILVVDDHSIDSTSSIAISYGAQVLRLEEELPPGWNGKPYASHQGALMARGDWLLFTDADTIHTRDGISKAVCYAQEANLDGLSLFINNQTDSWLQSIALEAAFAGLFAGWNPANYMLNGQFILIRREVYFESGGFAAVRGEALEDVALGNLLARCGYRLEMMRGDDIALVHMYATHKQMFDGLSRLGAGVLRWQGIRAGLSFLHLTALVSPLITLLGVLCGSLKWSWLPITWGTASLSLVPRLYRSGHGKLSILAPFGALFFMAAAVYGFINRIFGRGVNWKGRRV